MEKSDGEGQKSRSAKRSRIAVTVTVTVTVTEEPAIEKEEFTVPSGPSDGQTQKDKKLHVEEEQANSQDKASSVLQESQKPDLLVYRRTKSTRTRTNVGTNGGCLEASTSNAGDSNQGEARNHGTQRNVSFRAVHEVSEDTSSKGKSSDEEVPQEERKKPHRSIRSSWLLQSTHEEGYRYIPQLGDEVVYFRQGHQEYINFWNSREMCPWRSLKGNIRAVEFCKVKDLEYSSCLGSGVGCCKMILQFEDPLSNVVGKSFKLTLPGVVGFPDFLVERSRYDAAILRDWSYRDKCQVWWKNECEENGTWWEGRIVAVKPKSNDFPDSPWERFLVQYKNDPNVLQHSPWELYDADVVWEEPHIDDGIRTKLSCALAKLEQSGNKSEDHYGVRKLKQVSQTSNFINRFPVPLTLDLIQSRLENNYYRRFAAMKHDVEVLLENAAAFFVKRKGNSIKMKHLSDWFTRTLSSL